MQSGGLSAPAQMHPCSPCTSVHVQPGMPVMSAPLPPEILLTEDAGSSGLCIRWQSVGPMATGYVVELCEGSSASTERFLRQAPPQTVGTVELCVGGLVSGRYYAARVRSILQSGHESGPSAWSNWQSIPAAMLPCLPSGPALQSTPTNQQHPAQRSSSRESVLEKIKGSEFEADVKKVGMAGVLLPPEVTGNELLVLN